jgi:hypothetical protein
MAKGSTEVDDEFEYSSKDDTGEQTTSHQYGQAHPPSNRTQEQQQTNALRPSSQQQPLHKQICLQRHIRQEIQVWSETTPLGSGQIGQQKDE